MGSGAVASVAESSQVDTHHIGISDHNARAREGAANPNDNIQTLDGVGEAATLLNMASDMRDAIAASVSNDWQMYPQANVSDGSQELSGLLRAAATAAAAASVVDAVKGLSASSSLYEGANRPDVNNAASVAFGAIQQVERASLALDASWPSLRSAGTSN